MTKPYLGLCSESFNQLTGSREKLQETPICHGQIYGFMIFHDFPCSLQETIDLSLIPVDFPFSQSNDSNEDWSSVPADGSTLTAEEPNV